MAPLALSIALDAFVVSVVIVGNLIVGMLIAASLAVMFLAMWFVWPTLRRAAPVDGTVVFFVQARHPQNPYCQEQAISQRFHGDNGYEINTVGDGFLANFDGRRE
jgi:hypothetical protein